MSAPQKEIAERLNVSVSTVCRSLKNHPSIGADTRQRVIELAREMGYRPRRSATARRATDALVHLGVLVPGDPPPTTVDANSGLGFIVFSRLLRGMSEAAREWNATLHVDYVPREDCTRMHEAGRYPPALQQGMLQGLILSEAFGGPGLQTLVNTLPCVQMMHRADDQVGLNVDSIGQDDRRAIAELFVHLEQLGHRRIGFLSHGLDRSPGWARFAGYVEMTARRGNYDPALSLNVYNQSRQTMEQVAPQIALLIRQGVTGWICTDDRTGYDLTATLLARGLSVPGDVSICGFDNLHVNGLPKLTSIDSPFEAIGASAVRRLMRRIKDPTVAPVSQYFRGTLIQGQTTAVRPG